MKRSARAIHKSKLLLIAYIQMPRKFRSKTLIDWYTHTWNLDKYREFRTITLNYSIWIRWILKTDYVLTLISAFMCYQLIYQRALWNGKWQTLWREYFSMWFFNLLTRCALFRSYEYTMHHLNVDVLRKLFLDVPRDAFWQCFCLCYCRFRVNCKSDRRMKISSI